MAAILQRNRLIGRLQASSLLLGVGLAVAVLVGALAAVQPTTAAGAVVGLTCAVLFVARPFWLVLAWAALAMYGDELIGSQTVLGALSYLSLPCFVLVAGPRLASLGRQHRWFAIWLAFTAIVFVNVFRSPFDLVESLKLFIGYVDATCLMALILTEVTTARRSRRLLWAILLPACGVGGIAMYQFATGSGGYASYDGVYRVMAVFPHFNTLGFFMIVPLGLAAYLYGTARRAWAHLLSVAVTAMLALGLLLSFGRANYIGAGVTILTVLVVVAPPRRVVLLLAAGAVCVVVFLAGFQLDLSERLQDPENLRSRTIIWQVIFDRALESPVFGHGFWSHDAYVNATADDTVAEGVHSMYLIYFFDFGAIGLGLFLAIWAAFAAWVVRSFGAASWPRRYVMVTAVAGIAGVLVNLLTGVDLLNFAPSMYLFMVTAWAACPANQRGEPWPWPTEVDEHVATSAVALTGPPRLAGSYGAGGTGTRYGESKSSDPVAARAAGRHDRGRYGSRRQGNGAPGSRPV